jgi:acyl phosphate:glycerol-3-phosphate acyltransferase
MSDLLWIFFAFFCGALPFSVWVSRLAGHDPRTVGDRNPGATNALKAGGWKVGILAFGLEIAKTALPVGLAYQIFGLRGPAMVAVALAPLLGHAYSPFLRFKGGKAVAAALGMWIGLTIWDVPLVALACVIPLFLLLKNSGWALLLTLLGMAIYLYFFRFSPLFFWILGLQTLLLMWKHRDDLRKNPFSAANRRK